MDKKTKEDKFGLASLILGIFAVVVMLLGFASSVLSFFGFILMILTFIFAGIQLKKKKNNLAVTGLILAFIALAIFLILCVSSYTIGNCNKVFMEETYMEECDTICMATCYSEGYINGYDSEVIYETFNGLKTCKCSCSGCPT